MTGQVIEVSQTGVGIVYVPLDRHATGVTLQASLDGAATYSVDLTLDNLYRETPGASAVWSPIAAALTDATAAQMAHIDGFYGGLRLNVTVGAGTVRLRISQGR